MVLNFKDQEKRSSKGDVKFSLKEENFSDCENEAKRNFPIILSILPIIYFFSSITIIFIFICICIYNRRNKIGPKEEAFLIPEYFGLYILQPNLYLFFSLVCSITGASIIGILFSILKQRFKVPEYRSRSFKLYIMLFFGIVSISLSFLKGFQPCIENTKIKSLTEEFLGYIKVSLPQMLFLFEILFSLLFSYYSITILELLKNSNQLDMLNHYQHNKNFWYKYKIIILFYLLVFTLVYIVLILIQNKVFIFNLLSFYSGHRLSSMIRSLPYLLHALNSVMIFSFCFELKYLNLAFSNLEADYLFNYSN